MDNSIISKNGPKFEPLRTFHMIHWIILCPSVMTIVEKTVIRSSYLFLPLRVLAFTNATRISKKDIFADISTTCESIRSTKCFNEMYSELLHKYYLLKGDEKALQEHE